MAADPLFVDRDGADNILGYAQVNGVFVDGGADDNFYLLKNSPAIDRGDGWFNAATDRDGFVRADDPGTTNAGRNDYTPAVQSTSQFATSGSDVAKNFRSNNTFFAFTLPFAFPFYDGSYTAVNISTEGFLQFGDTTAGGDNQNSDAALALHRRIAPLWDNLRTDQTGDDIFINTSVANQVTIRWNATNEANNSDVQFSVTLFSNGQFRFDYGPGSTNLTPTVGVSYGNGRSEQLATGYDNASTLTSAHSILWTLQPGVADMGAYEFRGSSLDVTPPTIVASTPSAVQSGGNAVGQVSQLQLTLSEEVNPIDAAAPANYELRNAGPDHVFNSNDDIVDPLTPQYTVGSQIITLQIPSGPLAAGTYRLTVNSNINSSLHDLAGISLDGDANGTAGGAYVRTFTVLNPGDLNLDGKVSAADISALMTALANLNGYQTAHGLSLADLNSLADINHDGSVNNLDIQALIAAIATATPAPTFVRGDINGDGLANVADVSGLMTALSDLSDYQSSRHLSNSQLLAVADVNGDGHVNNIDFQSLISLDATTGTGGGSGSAASSGAAVISSTVENGNAAPAEIPHPIDISSALNLSTVPATMRGAQVATNPKSRNSAPISLATSLSAAATIKQPIQAMLGPVFASKINRPELSVELPTDLVDEFYSDFFGQDFDSFVTNAAESDSSCCDSNADVIDEALLDQLVSS